MIPALSHPQNDKTIEMRMKLVVPRSEGWLWGGEGGSVTIKGCHKDVSSHGVIPYFDHDCSYRNLHVKKITWNSIHMLYQCRFPSF